MNNRHYQTDSEYIFQDRQGNAILNITSSPASHNLGGLSNPRARFVNVRIGKNGIAKGPKIGQSGFELIDYDKELPVLYNENSECCGCSACFSICSARKIVSATMDNEDKSVELNNHGAIIMIPDDEGFLYPVIDASVCIRCYNCLRVCPIQTQKSADLIK